MRTAAVASWSSGVTPPEAISTTRAEIATRPSPMKRCFIIFIVQTSHAVKAS